MAKRTDERDDLLDLYEEEDDWDSDDSELNNGSDNDVEFSYDNLSTSEKKRYDKMKSDIENAVVEAIASGDPNSGAYKGIQRVLAKRDRELAETRAALAQVLGSVSRLEDKGQDMDFITNIVKDMLDEDGKKVYEDRYQKHRSDKKMTQQEQLLQALLMQSQGQPQFNPQVPMYGQMEEDPQIKEYRKQATTKLKAFAKNMGVDPNSQGLDYGDEDEALLTRMDKLAASVERVKNEQDDEEIDRVRRKSNVTQTRTRNEPVTKNDNYYPRDLLSRGTQKMVEQMRKNK